MAPSKDACVFCSCVFYGKQKFLRCGECNKRAHAKCLTLPDEDLQSIKSGVRRFVCNACNTASSLYAPASPNHDHGISSPATAPPALSSTPSRTAAATQPVDLGAELLSLRALLVDAVEGISFLSDQVARLGEDNERLRRESATMAEAHADVVRSLRQEVHSLRGDLVRQRGPPRLAEFPPLPTVAAAETKPPTPLPPISSPCVPPTTTSASPTSVASVSPARPDASPPTQQRISEPSAPTVPRRLAVGATDGTGLAAVDRRKSPKAIFVTKLLPTTTSAQVVSHLSSVGAVPILCKRLKTRHDSYASFYIAVDDACFQRLGDPALWPRRCLFKPFRGELHDKMIHAKENRRDGK